ncbi:MAG: hypothetical protein LBK06_00825 [Planctomycetaceae bacterium]|nr:hypothetical protein [Planctomycetaceae bacterium]
MHFFRTDAEVVLQFEKLNTRAQQRGAVVQGRSLSPYRLRYNADFGDSVYVVKFSRSVTGKAKDVFQLLLGKE